MIGRFRSNATQLSQNISNTLDSRWASPASAPLTHKAKLQPYYLYTQTVPTLLLP